VTVTLANHHGLLRMWIIDQVTNRVINRMGMLVR
jgi:hypothetical protein